MLFRAQNQKDISHAIIFCKIMGFERERRERKRETMDSNSFFDCAKKFSQKLKMLAPVVFDSEQIEKKFLIQNPGQ